MSEPIYDEDSIRSLDWVEHIRLRPGMYIGKLGDGSAADDGIYILAKEALDRRPLVRKILARDALARKAQTFAQTFVREQVSEFDRRP